MGSGTGISFASSVGTATGGSTTTSTSTRACRSSSRTPMAHEPLRIVLHASGSRFRFRSPQRVHGTLLTWLHECLQANGSSHPPQRGKATDPAPDWRNHDTDRHGAEQAPQKCPKTKD